MENNQRFKTQRGKFSIYVMDTSVKVGDTSTATFCEVRGENVIERIRRADLLCRLLNEDAAKAAA